MEKRLGQRNIVYVHKKKGKYDLVGLSSKLKHQTSKQIKYDSEFSMLFNWHKKNMIKYVL